MQNSSTASSHLFAPWICKTENTFHLHPTALITMFPGLQSPPPLPTRLWCPLGCNSHIVTMSLSYSVLWFPISPRLQYPLSYNAPWVTIPLSYNALWVTFPCVTIPPDLQSPWLTIPLSYNVSWVTVPPELQYLQGNNSPLGTMPLSCNIPCVTMPPELQYPLGYFGFQYPKVTMSPP